MIIKKNSNKHEIRKINHDRTKNKNKSTSKHNKNKIKNPCTLSHAQVTTDLKSMLKNLFKNIHLFVLKMCYMKFLFSVVWWFGWHYSYVLPVHCINTLFIKINLSHWMNTGRHHSFLVYTVTQHDVIKLWYSSTLLKFDDSQLDLNGYSSFLFNLSLNPCMFAKLPKNQEPISPLTINTCDNSFYNMCNSL